MVEIKIFQDGKEKTSVAGDLVVFSAFRDKKDGTDITSGIVGTGVDKMAVAKGLADIAAKVIEKVSDDPLDEALLEKIFLDEFIIQFCGWGDGKKCREEQE